MKAVEEFTIDRSQWLPAEMQNGYSALRTSETSDDKTRMCCLGIYLKACGVSVNDMLDVGLPAEVLDADKIPKGLQWLLENNYGDTSSDACRLAEVNDDNNLTLEERETKIKKIFKNYKVKVTFKNKLQGK